MIIYCITNLVNDKKYIGQTRYNSLNKRYNSDFTKNPSNDHLKHSYNKYGKDNFKIEIIQKCLNIKALNYWEKYYIILYETYNKKFGYNKEYGGNEQIFTEETRLKSSKYWKERVKTDAVLKNRLKKNNEDYWGKEENRQKKSENMKIATSSREHREKMALVQGAKPFDVYCKMSNEYVGTWINKAECARDLGLHAKTVHKCVAGKRKSHRNYIFKIKGSL